MIFKSVARVNEDRPDTHKLRLAVDDEPDLVADFDDSATQHHSVTNSKMIFFFDLVWDEMNEFLWIF